MRVTEIAAAALANKSTRSMSWFSARAPASAALKRVAGGRGIAHF